MSRYVPLWDLTRFVASAGYGPWAKEETAIEDQTVMVVKPGACLSAD